jgi:hypothetical protein
MTIGLIVRRIITVGAWPNAGCAAAPATPAETVDTNARRVI